MNITKESVDTVYSLAEEKLKSMSLAIDPLVMTRLEQDLTEMTNSYSYNEGDPIDPNLTQRIVNRTGLAMDSIRVTLDEKRRNGRLTQEWIKNYDPVKELMCVNDFVYAMVMKKLGCPNIPEGFGPAMKSQIATTAKMMSSCITLDQNPMYANNVYEAQRGKSAEFVHSKVVASLMAMRSKEATPAQVQKVLAEYQALKRRQDDHGPFWRLFHRAENKDRNAILKDMENNLKLVLGDNVNLAKLSSLAVGEGQIGKIVNEKLDTAFSEGGMSSRIGADVNASEANKNANEPSAELREQLANTLKENTNNEIQPQVDNQKVIDPLTTSLV